MAAPVGAPHALPVDAVAAATRTDPATGLSRADAARRLVADGPNELTAGATRTWLQRIGEQFANPLVLLLLAAIVISLVAWALEGHGDLPFDAIAIGAIVIVNAAIGAVQERRAEKAVAALQEMAAAQAGVIRGGHYERIPARDVVVGDVIVLDEGDAVPADARLTESRALAISEASLTGESVAVRKSADAVDAQTPMAERTCMVFAGTAAVAGHGRAVVTATGMNTEVGTIATLLDRTERQPTPLEREIAAVGRFLGIAVLVIAAVVVGAIVAVSDIDSASDLVEVLLIGVSLAVAAVPEGLPAVLSIVLAIGVQRMASRNALLRRLASAETLGSATVICSDKTGTLTQGEMTVRELLIADGQIDVTGTGYGPSGELRAAGVPLGSDIAGVARQALAAGARAGNATIRLDERGWVAVGDPTEAAIVAAAAKAGTPAARPGPDRLDELAFSAERKRMTVLVTGSEPASADPMLYTKGAPEVIVDRCSHELTTTGPIALSEARRLWWQEGVDDMAGRAMRTLAIAGRAHPGPELTEESEHDLVLYAVVGIIDPPREEAAPAVADAQGAGIRVVMITGDHPRTAHQIACDLGIADAASTPVTGRELDELEGDEFADAAATTPVFARVAPTHKLDLVEALQDRGEVVAMTGDGVNDAPALKAADIGTAMGVAGTDVAREAADLVLTDDNFATIVAAVGEGRGIFHNIRSFLRYLLSSNVGEVLTMFLGVVLVGVIGLEAEGEAVVAPLTAAQILWINLLTDTGPALALGVDPIDPGVLRRPPRRPGERVLDAAMRRGIALVGLTMAIITLFMFDLKAPGGLIEGSSDTDTARTAAFTVLVLAQLFNCLNARSDRTSAFHRWAVNPWLLLAIAGSVGLQVLVVYLPVLNDAFSTTPLSLADWLWSALLASSVLWVSEVRKLLARSSARTSDPGVSPSGHGS